MNKILRTLDGISKQHLISKLSGTASKVNGYSFEFATLLYSEMKDIDWSKSGGKTNFLEELVKNPSIHIKDAGCMRQIGVAGDFIVNHYDGQIDRLSKMYYWTFHNIARSRLSKNDDERNIELKKQLVEEVLSGKTKEGKIKARINEIKDKEHPKELEEHLKYYNVWNFSKLDHNFGVEYPGQIPGQILINIIYHYLQKDASIIDPMAGGGTTQDVCNFMNNLDGYKLQCKSFDLNPIRDFIEKKNSIEEDWCVENVDLVFLDPPYFTMKKDEYVENDFTKNREMFFLAIDKICQKAYNALKPGGICALIIQPQTEKDLEPGQVCLDLPFESYKIMERYFKPFNRIQTQLSTQQYNATDMNKVKDIKNRDRLLGIARDLIIMKKY